VKALGRLLWIAAALSLLLVPATADAHITATAMSGWRDAFNHPLHGWDHLVAMVTVGAWAARQRE